jgi:hypothetical protein
MPPDAHAALIARCLDWGREHAPRHQSERLLEAYRRRGIL